MALPIRIFALAWTLAIPCKGVAAEYRVQKDASLFAVLTHKAGFAAGLAHNHLISAKSFTAKLEFDEKSEQGNLSFQTTPLDLEVDNAELQSRWFPLLKQLGIYKDAFSEVPDKDKEEIREAMLDDGQLDAERHKVIQAQVTSLVKEVSQFGSIKFHYKANVVVTLHGKTVEKKVPVNLEIEGSTLQATAVARYKFTEFDIKPYSAFFGAVSNQDDFHLYVNLKADKL